MRETISEFKLFCPTASSRNRALEKDLNHGWTQIGNKPAKLTSEQLDAHLKANGRNAANLLAAFRTSGDPALLREAMEKFPNDPQVTFEVLTLGNLSLDEQRQMA